jgi:hypothetical protein
LTIFAQTILKKLIISTSGINIISDISDHLPIVHLCNMDNNKQSFNSKDNKIRYTRIINAENARTFTNEIGGLTWENILNENANPEKAYND